MSRLYAEYFGGVLLLKSMPNHGTDTFLYLPSMEGCLKNPDTETTFAHHVTTKVYTSSYEAQKAGMIWGYIQG